MVGVSPIDHRTAEQLRLIAGLRWRIFVNSLRTRRGKAELVARAFAGLSISVGVLGLGVGLAASSWAAFHQRLPLLLSAEFWLVFLVWQLLPIFITGFGAQADLGLLLRFPLRYSSFVGLTLAYGLVDPVSIVALFWLIMILAGIALGAPGALLWAIPSLFFFAALNLFLSRSAFAWLDRWLALRRTREVLGICFFLVMMSFQFCGPLTERWGRRAKPALARIEPIQRILPPGLAAYGIESGYGARPAPALAALGGLLAASTAFAWLLGVRLRAQYRGENLSEARVERVHREAETARQGWYLPGLSSTVGALLEKDLRYLLRNTAQYLNLAAPLILVAVFGLNTGSRGHHSIFGGVAFYPVAVGYCLLLMGAFVHNNLGYDGAGVAMLFAAPVRFRDVLLSKNILHGVLAVIEIVLVSIMVSILTGPPALLTALLTSIGALFVIFLNLAAGNIVSLNFPKRLQFGTIRRQRQSGIAVLLTIFVSPAAMGIAFGVYAFCRWAGHPDWALIVLLGLASVAFAVYKRVLDECSTIAIKKRAILVEELCKTQ